MVVCDFCGKPAAASCEIADKKESKTIDFCQDCGKTLALMCNASIRERLGIMKEYLDKGCSIDHAYKRALDGIKLGTDTGKSNDK